jgi:hypothetical protein
MRSAALKRKAVGSLEVDKENNVEDTPYSGKASWHQRHRSGAAMVFKPFKVSSSAIR